MLASWVTEEVKDVDLQDKRLNDRFAVVLDQLAGHPTASIPAACGGSTEMRAAYRFFDKVGSNFKCNTRSISNYRVFVTEFRFASEMADLAC